MKSPSLLVLFIFVECLESSKSVSPGVSTVISLIKEWTLSGSADIPFPEGFLTVHELIRREGFASQAHEVTTEDGYILSLTRILQSDHDPDLGPRRPPILMVHGVEAASDQWVLRGKRYDLAFILTDTGFDVWLADVRGNSYSRKHRNLTDVDPKFWNFSFHEHGVYDIAAFVDYVLNSTEFDQIGYIGHSMGTTEFLVLTSLLPDYNRKIGVSVLLAPVGPKYPFDDIKNPIIRLVLTNIDTLVEALVSGGIYEFHPRSSRLAGLLFDYCAGPPFQDYCLDVLGLIVGEHRTNLDRANCAAQLSHFPAGSSIKTLHHLAQVFVSGFKQFDYGPEENLLIYNNSSPPRYPLHLITAPTFLFYGDNDPWTSSKVVQYLADTIPGVKQAKIVQDLKFTHFDFLIGVNTNETLYQDVLQIMTSYMRNLNQV